MDAGQIFMELASGVRREMLEELGKKEMRLKALSDELGITIQETHRNISRLQDAGLLKKNGEGAIALTPFGNIILKQINGFEFIAKNDDYFEEHSLGDLPEIQAFNIAALSNSTLVEGVVRVFEIWKSIYNRAEKYIHAIKAQVSLEMITAVSEAINNGIKYSYILGQDVIVPPGRSELLKKLRWKERVTQGLIERKMAKSVPIVVVLNEKEASVLFPGLNGMADLNKMFYSSDPLFHKWCLDYFRYKWSNSEVFDESKVKEI